MRKQRGIALRDNDGPTDITREELLDGDGGDTFSVFFSSRLLIV